MTGHNRNSFIDLLKGIAILSVVLYHANLFKWGYLGVDLFFAIAGYLTTRSYLMSSEKFRILKFLSGKAFRLMPLLIVAVTLSLLIGYFAMLPDDYENLANSVVATNVFCNNALMYITSADYWNVVNEFKPLMHTWYLGVLAEYYLVMAFVFALYPKSRKNNLWYVIFALMVLSLALAFVVPGGQRFYFLPGRFWEFGIGSLVACRCSKYVERIQVSPKANAIVYCGIASYSIYIWHQFVFAFLRYLFGSLSDYRVAVFSFVLIVALSPTSYLLFETKRAIARLKRPLVCSAFLVLLVMTTVGAWQLHCMAGVVRDVAELDIAKGKGQKQMHASYNSRIYELNRPFTVREESNGRTIRLFVYGDSYARDFANIILESCWSNVVEISYVYTSSLAGVPDADVSNRVCQCDCAIAATRGDFQHVPMLFRPLLDDRRMLVIGTKRFGFSNGFAYVRRWTRGYLSTRVKVEDEMLARNRRQAEQYADAYVDMLKPLMVDGTVPVFTPLGGGGRREVYQPGLPTPYQGRCRILFAVAATCSEFVL